MNERRGERAEAHHDQVKRQDGPQMSLLDAEPLCAFARFYDPEGQVWHLVDETEHAHARTMVEREAGGCPSGRLIAMNRKGEALEPTLPPSIGLFEVIWADWRRPHDRATSLAAGVILE